MISRFFKKTTQLQRVLLPIKTLTSGYHTEITLFKKGCIIKTLDNNKSPIENEFDLLKALPQSFYYRECLTFLIDPTAFSSKDTNGKRHMLTKATHIAGCIMTPFHDKIQLNEKTALSLVHGATPKGEKDAEIEGIGVVTKQDYQVTASFHSAGALLEHFKRMPRKGFFERYFLIVPIDDLVNDKAKYIANTELEVQRYKEKVKIYNRLFNACPHPILEVFGRLDLTKANRFKAITPQRAAFFAISELLKNNSELLEDFRAAAETSGLSRTALDLGKILENREITKQKNTVSDPQNGRRPL